MCHLFESLESRKLLSAVPVSATVTADLAKLAADRAQFHADVVSGHAVVKADNVTLVSTAKADRLAVVLDRKALAHDHGNATAEAADLSKLNADSAKFVADMSGLKATLAADFLHWKTTVHNDVLTVQADVVQLAHDRRLA